MSESRGGKLRIALAILVMAALAAASLIGTATAGPNDPVTNKKLRKRSGAYSKYHDAPILVLNSGNINAPGSLVTTLSLPKGKFVIVGKVSVIGNGGDTTCRVQAGGDFDESTVTVLNTDFNQLVLTVTHKFDGAGTASLRCVSGGGATQIEDVKLTGMEFPKLRNEAF